MDKYEERIVVAKAETSAYLIMGGLILLILASVFLMLRVSPLLGFFALCCVIGVMSFAKDNFHIEYEYIIVNGDIEISKIINKNRRKKIVDIPLESITKMDYAESPKTKNDIDIAKDVKVSRFVAATPGEDSTLVAIYSTDKKNSKRIDILDFNEKCLTHMKDVLKMKSEIK